MAVRISKKLVDHAKIKSKVENRSITGQIEYWAKIGKIAEENPALSFYHIKEIMTGIELLENKSKSEYKFG
jgi:hypothetical protein